MKSKTTCGLSFLLGSDKCPREYERKTRRKADMDENGLGRAAPIPFSSYTLAPYSLHEKMERTQANYSKLHLQQSRSVGEREIQKVDLRENEKPKVKVKRVIYFDLAR